MRAAAKQVVQRLDAIAGANERIHDSSLPECPGGQLGVVIAILDQQNLLHARLRQDPPSVK
jgi:hypothetical protein